MARDAATIKRKIYFFRAFVGRKPNKEPIVYDFASAFDELMDGHGDEDEQCIESGAEPSLLCWLEAKNPQLRIRFGHARTSDWPLAELKHKTGPLKMATGGRLCEQSHAVFFPNRVVGCEIGPRGPRMSALSDMFALIGRPPIFRQLIKKDAVQELQRFASVTKFTYRLENYEAAKKAGTRNIWNATEFILDEVGGEVIEVTVSVKRGAKRPLKDVVLGMARHLVRSQEIRDHTLECRVHGRNHEGRSDDLDLLEDKLVTTGEMLKMDKNSRAVTSSSAYSKIAAVYTTMRDEIESALEVGEKDDEEDT